MRVLLALLIGAVFLLFTACVPVRTTATTSNGQSNERFDEGMVTITFDDGFKNGYEVALPLLRSAKIRANFFVITNTFHKNDARYMTESDMLRLVSADQETGSHSQSHPHLTRLSDDKIKEEVLGSKKDLMARRIPSCTFAYPYDDYNDNVVRVVKSSRYIGARTCAPGFNFRDSDRFLLKDQTVIVTTTPKEIRAWVDKAIAERTWLILVFHSIDRTGLPYSATPETLQATIECLRARNVKTVTMAEGIKKMR